MCRRFFITFLFLICNQGLIATAAEDPPKKESFKEYLIRRDKEISEEIDNAAQRIDVAIAGEDISKKPNLTHIIIHQRIDWAVEDYFNYTPYLDLRLNLPNVERKFQLKFTTYDDDQVERGINRNRLQTTPVRQTYTGDVGFFQKLGNINFEFQPRVELRDGVQTSYISKFTSNARYSIFNFHPELQLFAKSDEGVGEFVGLDSDIILSKTYSLSFITEEQYIDQENQFTTNLGTRVSNRYNDSFDQFTALVFESSSRTTYHLDKWTLMYGFTHKFWRNVLHYTTIPYWAFSRDYSFRGSPGVIVEINLIF